VVTVVIDTIDKIDEIADELHYAEKVALEIAEQRGQDEIILHFHALFRDSSKRIRALSTSLMPASLRDSETSDTE